MSDGVVKFWNVTAMAGGGSAAGDVLQAAYFVRELVLTQTSVGT